MIYGHKWDLINRKYTQRHNEEQVLPQNNHQMGQIHQVTGPEMQKNKKGKCRV